jgi:hypothetical protein
MTRQKQITRKALAPPPSAERMLTEIDSETRIEKHQRERNRKQNKKQSPKMCPELTSRRHNFNNLLHQRFAGSREHEYPFDFCPGWEIECVDLGFERACVGL